MQSKEDSAIPAPSLKGSRWTLAHGFFVQMGGFVLSEGGLPIHILLDGTLSTTRKERHLIYNIEQNIIDAPRITEEEIQDRGKGDIISKIFIIVQTTWFVVQCLARWSQHLQVSELEVVTLGFAMLNGVTYALWWHKPQNVGCPVLIERKNPQGISSETPFIPLNSTNNYNPVTSENFAESQAVDTEKPTRPNLFRKTESWMRRELRNTIKTSTKCTLPTDLIVALFLGFVHPMMKLMGDEQTSEDRTPMFYAAATNKGTWRPINFTLVAVVGSLFGVVHLVPSWFPIFPSHQSIVAWRVSAMIMTIAPFTMGLSAYLDEDVHPGSAFSILVLLYTFCILLYPIARIVILILALTSLRSLTPATLQTIEWTTFIPHLQGW